jgi:putative sugar O-methyltransferase
MKHNYPELELIKKINISKKKIYQPTSFWEKPSEKIQQEIINEGLANFRKLPTPLSFFVPNYGIPTNSFSHEISKELLDLLKKNGSKKQKLAMGEFLSGYFHALSDYRVFLASNDESKKPFLKHFSESTYGNPLEQFEFDGKKYSRSSLNYIQGLCFLKSFIERDEIKTVLEIGGGFGSLGEILKYSEDIKYIDIDIPPMSFITWKYLENVYGNENIEPYVQNKNEIFIENIERCAVLNSWDIEKLNGEIDLFVNFVSFQEMEPHIVENYLTHVKRLNPKWVLLRNMREGKQIKKPGDVGVEVPIKKGAYLEMLQDKYNRISTNVFPYGYKTVDGFHSELFLFKRISEK